MPNNKVTILYEIKPVECFLTDEEQWVALDGFSQSYEISTHGRVRSRTHTVVSGSTLGKQFSRTFNCKILSSKLHKSDRQEPHMSTTLVLSNTRRLPISIPEAMVKAFFQKSLFDTKIVYKDGDSSNCKLDNLTVYAVSYIYDYSNEYCNTQMVKMMQMANSWDKDACDKILNPNQEELSDAVGDLAVEISSSPEVPELPDR